MSEYHALYRFFDENGVLLYVGITADIGSRFKKHRGDKPWWYAVSTIRIERFPTRPAVLAAEREAIRSERPLWNVSHNEAATAVRSQRGDIWDGHGRLILSEDPVWRQLAITHPQLLAVERHLLDVGDMYVRLADENTLYGTTSEAYVCAHELWYGYGNARDLLGGPRLSCKAIAETVAGLVAGLPLVDETEALSWPDGVFAGPLGLIHVIIGRGWDPPAELLTPEVGYLVYQRMFALMPICSGPSPCGRSE